MECVVKKIKEFVDAFRLAALIMILGWALSQLI